MTEKSVAENITDPMQSFDAREWAESFVAHVKANPDIATDEGTMIAWFAGALMRGWDEHARTYPTDALINAVSAFDAAAERETNPFRQRDEVLIQAFALARPHVDPDSLERRGSLRDVLGPVVKTTLVLLLLLLPSSLFAQDKPFTVAKTALVAAAAADASTTMFLLGQQPEQFREGNPILRSFANKPLIFGAVQGGTTAALLIVLHRVHRTHPTLATVLALGMASFETGLAVRTAGRVR